MKHPVRHLREITGRTQAELAEAAGTSQPTIAAYEAGRTSPTLRTVRGLARAAGLDTYVTFHPPMTREERRSLAFHEVIAQRLQEDPERVIAKARRTLVKMRKVAPTSRPIAEWRVLLDRPPSDLLPVLTDPSPWARELRHVTPFAGVLSARERAEVIRATREQAEGRS